MFNEKQWDIMIIGNFGVQKRVWKSKKFSLEVKK